jgi:hypothetical protein
MNPFIFKNSWLLTIAVLWAYSCTPQKGDENNSPEIKPFDPTAYARAIMEKLASAEMHGRAAEYGGEEKAARYLAAEYGKLGLKSFNDSTFQTFNLKGRTGQIHDHYLAIDGEELSDQGDEFLVIPWSGSDSGTYPLIWLNNAIIDEREAWTRFKARDLSNHYLVADLRNCKNEPEYSTGELRDKNPLGARGVIELIPQGKRFSTGAGSTVKDFAILRVKESSLPKGADSIALDIKTKLYQPYMSRNIVRYIEGQKDSFIVFTAHYDHLGHMGKNAFFSGFQDNASGSALLLALANYFSERETPPPYSLAFMTFGAEETGTQGSGHYVRHPLFPLEQIKILFNFDMVASGDTSIKICFATQYPGEYARFDKINKEKRYVDTLLYLPPNSASDHRAFDAAGVKSMFIQAIEEPYKFHTVEDKPEAYPMENFDAIFGIMKDYVESYER